MSTGTEVEMKIQARASKAKTTAAAKVAAASAIDQNGPVVNGAEAGPTASAPAVITPTVGRRVHFHPNEEHQAMLGVFDAQQPCDAGVIYVWGDRCVNLDVTGPSGVRNTLQSVTLLQGDDQPAEGESYAAWMPYQTKQAATATGA